MALTMHYVIRPRAELRAAFPAQLSALAEFCLATRLWTRPMPDRTTWHSEDYAAHLKLLFLGLLHTECRGEPDYGLLVPDARLSLSLFDRWWSLEQHLLDYSVSECESALSPEAIHALAETGLPSVDHWVRNLRRHADTVSPH